MTPPAPAPTPAAGPSALGDAARRKRLLLGAGAAAALIVLVVLQGRRGGGGGGSAEPDTPPPVPSPTAADPQTFADNGGQAADLGNFGTALMGFNEQLIKQLVKPSGGNTSHGGAKHGGKKKKKHSKK